MNPIWVGLFNVTGAQSNLMLDGNVGAILWICAQAEDAAKLQLRATNVMSDLRLTVIESKQMQEVVDENALSEELATLVPEARRNIDSVVCGTWHFYKGHDA